MSRKDDLEYNILESYDIIREYEAIIRIADRPEEVIRAQRVTQKQWSLIEDYLAEYCNLVGETLPDEIVQIAAHFELRKKESPDPVATCQPFEEMFFIPAGDFLMGSDPEKDEHARDAEQPQHCLYLPNYYIAKTPVTNAQYLAFVRATGYRQLEHWKEGNPPSGKYEHPVAAVSWFDAMAYCRWLTDVWRTEGKITSNEIVRLPTEAEWEKAARGSDRRIYPWGCRWDVRLCNCKEANKRDTTPVDHYPEGTSPYGLLDMAGNVYEWTISLWGRNRDRPEFKYPYDPNDGRESLDTKVIKERVLHVLRGGSFNSDTRYVRCAHRYKHAPNRLSALDGFRVIISPTSPNSAR